MAESEERPLHKTMGVLLLPLVKTIKKFIFTSDISIYSFFPTRKIYVIAASFLTLQFEYFTVDWLSFGFMMRQAHEYQHGHNKT